MGSSNDDDHNDDVDDHDNEIITVTRSTGTMHTSAKAHLTSCVVIFIWIWIRIRSRLPPKFNNLLIDPLPTFPENFVQIWKFCTKLLTDKQADKQR